MRKLCCDRKLERLALQSLFYVGRLFFKLRKADRPLNSISKTFQLKSNSGVQLPVSVEVMEGMSPYI